MTRRGFFFLVAALCAMSSALAQNQSSELLNKPDPLGPLDATSGTSLLKPARTDTAAKPAAKEEKGPTEITATQEANFDEKTHKAIFIGDVHVNDPQFKLVCDKLTAFLKKTAVSSSAAKESPTPSPKPAAAPDGGGGLDHAIAEGHVIITQDKPNPDGGEPTHYIGRGARADYDAKTGNVTLTGWPEVQSGINTQISTAESTVMIMNRDGTMKTVGPSKTRIQEEKESKKSSPRP